MEELAKRRVQVVPTSVYAKQDIQEHIVKIVRLLKVKLEKF